jgi:hypothetical protein
MTVLKCDRCGQEIKGDESWERDVHDKPFDPYESEYAFNKYGGNARHVGECPAKPVTTNSIENAPSADPSLSVEEYARFRGRCPNCKGCVQADCTCGKRKCDCVPNESDAYEPTLELTIVDLGESCVVKVEKGSYSTVTGLVKPLNTTYPRKIDQPFVVEHSFFELRKAIEGDKPVPRIIRDNEGYLLVEDANTNEFLAKDTYDALSQLAGKPLPIHSNGTWEQLVTTNGVTIWKYSR